MSLQTVEPKSKREESDDSARDSADPAGALNEESQPGPVPGVPRYMRGNSDLENAFSPNYSQRAEQQADYRAAVASQMNVVTGGTDTIPSEDPGGASEESPDSEIQNQEKSEVETADEAEAAEGENEQPEEPEADQEEAPQEGDEPTTGSDEQAGPARGTVQSVFEQAETPELLAILPRMSPIRTPFVPSPPPPAIERREEITKRTGSPPELHHAQVRQAVERAAQAARDAQRRMIWLVGNAARDTRISIEEMALEIRKATAAAVAQIDTAIGVATKDIKRSAEAEIIHIGKSRVLVGEDLQKSRDSQMKQIFDDLKKGSKEIEEADKEIRKNFDAKLNETPTRFQPIPTTGEGVRFPVPTAQEKTAEKEPDKPPEPPKYKTVKPVKAKLMEFGDKEATTRAIVRFGITQRHVKQYMVDLSRPLIDGLSEIEQKSLVDGANKRSGQLNSDATRAQFATIVLGLTSPVSKHHEDDKGKTVPHHDAAVDQQLTEARLAEKDASRLLKTKSDNAIKYCQKDLRDTLTSNIRKAGNKAYQAVHKQGKASEIVLNNAAVPMAEAYRDLVARIDALLPPNRFLNSRTLVPRLLVVRDSAAKLCREHEALAARQRAATIASMQKVVKDQVDSIADGAAKSVDSVHGVVKGCQFDYTLFSSQMTGRLSDGSAQAVKGAQAYARKVAEGILKAKQGVQTEGAPKLDEIAARFMNGAIESAEQAQYFELEAFVKSLENTSDDNNAITSPMVKANAELRSRASKLDNAMPQRSAAKSIGLSLLCPLVGGVYLYKTRAKPDEVIKQLGDLVWPGAGAVEEVFNMSYGSLRSRIEDKLSDPEETHALNLLSENPRVRATTRIGVVKHSFGWWNYSREAREAAAAGMSRQERATLSDTEIEAIRTTLISKLSASQAEIAAAYLDNNRERAVAAKTREGLNDAKKQGAWGWIFSAQAARQKSDQARVDAIAGMNAALAAELERESSYLYVSEQKLKLKSSTDTTDKFYREFASLNDPFGRTEKAFTAAQGREALISYATASHAAAVLRPGMPFVPGMLLLPSATVSLKQIQMSEEARNYVRAAVGKGVESDEARTARAAYEVKRAEGDDTSDLSETSQMRLTDAFEDHKLAELERQAREGTPLERSGAQRLLVKEREAHQKRMQQIAVNLGAPKEVRESPALAEKWVADRVGGLFARTDTSSNTPVSHYRYGREMVTQGRASLAAGVAVATEKRGTHEDLLRRAYTNRSKAEIAAANKDWADTHGGEDMEVMLGIKKRKSDAWDYAAMAATPIFGPGALAANWLLRGPETSGDLAMELERLARGNRKSDLDHATYAGLHYNQERVRGTGFIAEHSMQGTDEQRNLDGDQTELAKLILAEAAKKNPGAAAFFSLYPAGIFGADGSINPTIEKLAFDDKGQFLGDRSLLRHYSQNVSLSADAYRAEIDRQEAIITTAISVLAIVVSIALMLIPGVNIIVAGLIVTAIAGAATMIAKAGMRGERYGWEEMATDLAMTGIEMATAGIGGGLAGGLGKAGMLARVGNALTARLGKVGAAVVREAFVGALNGGAQVALQDEVWADGLSRGLERVVNGALRGAAVGAVSAGVSESIAGRLNKSMHPGNIDPTEFSRMQKLGSALGPHGGEIFREGVSNMLGGLASEAVGIVMDYANGQFKGNFGDALKQIGETGLRELVTGAMRGGVTSMNRARYRTLLDAARKSGGDLSPSDMRVLRLAAISAGALSYGEGMGNLHAEIHAGRQMLSILPPAMREHAATLDVQSLHKLTGMLDSGDLGSQQQKSQFLRALQEMIPGLDGRGLMQQMEDVINNRPRLAETDVVPDTAEKTRLREQIASGLDDNLKSSLDRVRIDGLEHLPEADLRVAAEMVARGAFDSPTADALLRRAKQANPDLNEYTFLQHLFGAVETSRQAQQLDRMAREQRRSEVLSLVPEEGQRLFVDLPDDSIKQVKQMLDGAKLGSPGEQEELFRAALVKDPELTREGFQRMLEGAVDNAIAHQAEMRETARARREQQLLNVPEELRGILSVLPEDALIELRLRQVEGGTLSPAERSRFLDAARLEIPGVDVMRLSAAMDQAVAARPQDMPAEHQARLRRELESGVPAEQRALLADATILVMRDSEFEAFTRSKTGQAVTLIVDGRPVVVMRDGASPAVLREEGIHVLQRKDPEWAARLGALDERRLAQWDKLPLAEQLALYRNKVEIEIDAQRRMAGGLEGDLAGATDPAERARLKTQLEMAHSTLRNLENRAMEAGGIGDLQMRAMQAGVVGRPDWLDQPARLFAKPPVGTTEADPVRIEPEREPTRKELDEQLVEGLGKAKRREYLSKAEKLTDASLRALLDVSGGSPGIVRSFLSHAHSIGDIPGFIDHVVGVMRSLSPDQQTALGKRSPNMETEELKGLIHGLVTLRDAPGTAAEFHNLVNAATQSNKVNLEDIKGFTRVAQTVSPQEMSGLLKLAPDTKTAKRILMCAADAENPTAFSRDFVRVMGGFTPERLAIHRNLFLDMPFPVLRDVVSGLSRLRAAVENDETYRVFVNLALKDSTTERGKLVNSMAEMMESTDARGRKALASLLDQMDPKTVNKVPLALLYVNTLAVQIESRAGGRQGELFNLLIETAAATRRNWRVFFGDISAVLIFLDRLPRTADNDKNVREILNYFSNSRGDLNAPPQDFVSIRNHPPLRQLAADITASAAQLKGSKDKDRAAIIDLQVKNLQNSDPPRLAGQDAWQSFLNTEAVLWKDMKSGIDGEETKAFANLLESVTKGWSEGQLASLKDMAPWFDHLATTILGLHPNDEAGRKKLLEDIFAKGFGNGSQNLSSEGKLDSLTRAFREMAVDLSLKKDPHDVNPEEALNRIGLKKADLEKRSDGAIILEHVLALARQEIYYKRMIDIAGTDTKMSTAGMSQKTTEVVGEIALTLHVLKNFPDLQLQFAFTPGTGFDQVWLKRDSSGVIVDCVIGEAKGPGAKLGNPAKGEQMTVKWVLNTIEEMMSSSDPEQQKLGLELMDAVNRSRETGQKFIRGRVIEAVKASPDEPKDITEAKHGKDGYDFNAIGDTEISDSAAPGGG